ncbi:MAG: hypothetical protein R2865_00610 [Deinococcales bacterium]
MMSTLPSKEGVKRLYRLLSTPKYEMIPLDNAHKGMKHLPKNSKVSISVSPSKGFATTLALAQELSDYIPAENITPHISARLTSSRQELEQKLKKVMDLGIKELFLVGGDRQDPLGPL